MNLENKNELETGVIINDIKNGLNDDRWKDITLSTLPIDNKITFLGKLCCNKHDYNSTGMSRRFISGGRCTECRNRTRKRWYLQNTKRCHDLTNKWRDTHREQSNFSAKLWRKSNPEKYKQTRYKYESKSWINSRIIGKKAQCKRLGIIFDLTVDFLTEAWNNQNGKCYWLNIPITLERGKNNPLKATLDRLDPSGGYTKDNVVWSSYFANVGRGNCSSEKFLQIIEMVSNSLTKK